jgi:hypothetical protein
LSKKELQMAALVRCLPYFAAICIVVLTAHAADEDCGPCNGKWVVSHWRNSTPAAAVAGAWTNVNQPSTTPPVVLGRHWKEIGGALYGSYTVVSAAESYVPAPGLGVPPMMKIDGGQITASGQSEKNISGWNAGTGKAPCNHERPTNAVATVTGTGTASVEVTGDARNDYINPLGPDKGIVSTKGKAEVQFTTSGAWPTGQKSAVVVETDTSHTESGGLNIKIGTITVTFTGVTVGPTTIDINLSAATKDKYTKSSGIHTATVSKRYPATGSDDISGFNIVGVGSASAHAWVDVLAYSAIAKATTSIDTLSMNISNAGTADGCCNGQKPKHGGHGVENKDPAPYP